MKIKKLLSVILSVCIVCLCFGNILQVSAASEDMVAVSVINFADNAWDDFAGGSSLVQTDGTKIEASLVPGANFSLKGSNNEGFVTNLNGVGKYLQYDAATGGGINVITVSPQAALTEDFSLEFKAAGKRNTSNRERYLSVVMVPDGSDNTAGTTVMGWNNSYMYDTGTAGNGSRWPNNTTPLQLIIPNWGTTQKYAIGYSETDFRSYKIDVHFNEGDLPTFDLWGVYAAGTGLEEDEDGRQLLLKNVKFAEKDGTGQNAVDYSKGIGSIRIEMGSKTSDEGIAFADIKISQKAKIQLFDIFSDNMMISSKNGVTVRGWGLSEGADICAQILDNGTVVLESYGTANESGRFSCKFDDVSELDYGKNYTMLLKCGTVEKIIENVGKGNVWFFDGDENFNESEHATGSARLYVTDENGRGSWISAENTENYSAVCSILNAMGENSAGIIGTKEIDSYSADGVVYFTSSNDAKNYYEDFNQYIKNAESNGLKVVYTTLYNKEALSADSVFDVQKNTVKLEKENYNCAIRVPIASADSFTDICKRITDAALYGKRSPIDYELSVSGNKAYIILSQSVGDVTEKDFCASDISGKICKATVIEKNDKTLIITFDTEKEIVNVCYGKDGVTEPVYSADGSTVLSPFETDFDAKEEFSLSKEFDCCRFEALYGADSENMVENGFKLSDGTVLERAQIGYSADETAISFDSQGSGHVKLSINDVLFFETDFNNNFFAKITRENGGNFVNGMHVEDADGITVIDKIRLDFSETNEAVMTAFKAEMKGYSDILGVVFAINELPDVKDADYSDVEKISAVCEKFDALGGEDGNFSDEVKEKVRELKAFCKSIETEKEKIAEKISVTFASVDDKSLRTNIIVSNSSALVPFNAECLAAVYDSDGRLVKITSVKETLNPGKNVNITLDPGISGFSGGYVSFYVINDISDGLLLGENSNIQIK